MTWLRDDPELHFDMLTDLTAVDLLPAEPRFAVVYHLYSTQKKHRIRLRVPVEEDEPSVDSLRPVWRGVEWFEREVWDMYGVKFNGHPDLRRILMWEGYPHYPLRKDFPLEGKPTEVPDVAVTDIAPMEGGPFVTVASSEDATRREPRRRNPEDWE